MSNIWDKFLLEVEEIEEMAARYKKKGVELPSQLEEIETYVSDPPKYFITFTSDLRPTVADITNKQKLKEVKGRTKRKFGKGKGVKQKPWWKSLTSVTDKAQRSPAIPKVGINPKSKYNTPNGIYSYPLTTKIYRDMSRGELPFAQNQPYFSIFKISEGAKIFTIDQNGNVDGFDEQDYEQAIDTLISNQFFDNLSKSRVTGQKKDDDPKEFWPNYQYALEATQEGDFSGIKEGFGGEFVKKYLIPRIKGIASYHNVHTMNLSETDQIYLELDELLTDEYEGMPDDVDIPRYQYLDDFEIFLEDLSSVMFDWFLATRNEERADLKRAAIDLLNSTVFKNIKEWKTLERVDDWIEKINKISKESDNWLEQKTYPNLSREDIILVRSVMLSYQDYSEDNEESLMPIRLMPMLVNTIIAEMNVVNDEIAGQRKKKGNIEDFLEIEDYKRRHPKNTDFVKNIENRALVDSPFGRLWSVTRALADTDKDPASTNKWARILKYLGIDAIIDLGSGLVHRSEPTQAVVFDMRSIKVEKSFENKSTPARLKKTGSRKSGLLRAKFLKMARLTTKTKKLPKEYHKELERLSTGIMGKRNMGLKQLQMMLVRNNMHFPASDEHISKRMEDPANFMRNTPAEDDRQLDFNVETALVQLTDEEVSRLRNLGYLPLFNPNYMGLFAMIEQLNTAEPVVRKNYNKSISSFNDSLSELAKEDNAKIIVTQIKDTANSGVRPEDIGWYRLKPIIEEAAEKGFDTSKLLENLMNLMKIQGLIKGFAHQRLAIDMQKEKVSEAEENYGSLAADKLLNLVYPKLVKRTKGLISGNIDNITLLDIRQQRYGEEYDDLTIQMRKSKSEETPDEKSNQAPWEKAYDELVTEIQMFFEKYERKGKCVYKKETGEKKGCSDTVAMAKKYVKALYANADDIKEDIDEYFLREEDEEETFDDVSTADILNPNIPAPWETNN